MKIIIFLFSFVLPSFLFAQCDSVLLTKINKRKFSIKFNEKEKFKLIDDNGRLLLEEDTNFIVFDHSKANIFPNSSFYINVEGCKFDMYVFVQGNGRFRVISKDPKKK